MILWSRWSVDLRWMIEHRCYIHTWWSCLTSKHWCGIFQKRYQFHLTILYPWFPDRALWPPPWIDPWGRPASLDRAWAAKNTWQVMCFFCNLPIPYFSILKELTTVDGQPLATSFHPQYIPVSSDIQLDNSEYANLSFNLKVQLYNALEFVLILVDFSTVLFTDW